MLLESSLTDCVLQLPSVRDAADKVVQGSAKFEQLTVASQEISASTAQLVFASRVKAEPQSVNLRALTEASKDVSNATGGVVAAAKHCAQLVEESGNEECDEPETSLVVIVSFSVCLLDFAPNHQLDRTTKRLGTKR